MTASYSWWQTNTAGLFFKIYTQNIFLIIKNCKCILCAMAWGSLFAFKSCSHFPKRWWGLAQDNYGPDKIGLVTLPQKANKKKKIGKS